MKKQVARGRTVDPRGPAFVNCNCYDRDIRGKSVGIGHGSQERAE